MSERSDEFGAFLIGLVVGGLTGAMVALLFAPQSGEETRTLIKEKSIELRDKATKTAEEAKVKAGEIATQAKARGQQALEGIKKVATRKRAAPAESASE